MRTPSGLPPPGNVYRVLTPTSWEKNKLKTNVFRMRDTEESVSVYEADTRLPRAALQAHLDVQREKLQSGDDDERAGAENFFAKYGESVQSMVEHGWRVARLATSELEQRGFQVGAPDATGHVDVLGDRTAFEDYSRELSRASKLLSPEDCLAE